MGGLIRDEKFLLLDAASPLVQTGLWHNGGWIRWIGSREEAGRSLFLGVEEIFREETVTLHDLDGFFFCAGPGSMLGIRMAAMAVRGWQSLLPKPLPVFTYSSHDLLARILQARGTPGPFHVISDARRKHWHVTSVTDSGLIEPLQRLEAGELAGLTGPLYRMEEVIRSEAPVPIERMAPYLLENDAARFLEADLLHPGATADPLVLESPEFKKWSAERHR